MSRARNNAVVESKTDVVILADADTLPDSAMQVDEAKHLALEQRRQVFLFDHRQLLDADGNVLQTWRNHHGGLFAIRREDYWKAGGFDERFGSWGSEDTAFWLACETILGTSLRAHGNATAWNHSRPDKGDWKNTKLSRHEYRRKFLYWWAHSDEYPQAMMEEVIRGNHNHGGAGGIDYLL